VVVPRSQRNMAPSQIPTSLGDYQKRCHNPERMALKLLAGEKEVLPATLTLNPLRAS